MIILVVPIETIGFNKKDKNMTKDSNNQEEINSIIKKLQDKGMENVQIFGEDETHYHVSFARPLRWDDDGNPAGYSLVVIKEQKNLGYTLELKKT